MDDRTQIGLSSGVQPGTQLNGIYEIDVKIAAGGMGEVYKGHNIQTGDPVAIKIVLPDFAKDPTILALFRKEASVLNHLAHGAIVRYYVFSIDPGIARPYLAMEFVDGQSLAEAIEAGPLSTPDASLLIGRVASGLAAAHEAGVIHRDLSPDNIILKGGRVDKAKIIDFGIARSETVGGGTLLGGRFAGKYNFVSPEQLGLFGGEVSERSDIYSLGLVFAAALLGEPLNMSGSQVDVIEKRRVVPPLGELDPEMRPIVEAMLQPDPADRPDSMDLIAEWLTPAPTWRPSAEARGGAAAGRGPKTEAPVGGRGATSAPAGYSFPPATTPPSRPAAIRENSAARPETSQPPSETIFTDRGTSVAPAQDGWPQEEPYRYIASNPPLEDQTAAGGAYDDGEHERRGRRRGWLIGAVAFAALLSAAGGAAYYGGLIEGIGPLAGSRTAQGSSGAPTLPTDGGETPASGGAGAALPPNGGGPAEATTAATTSAGAAPPAQTATSPGLTGTTAGTAGPAPGGDKPAGQTPPLAATAEVAGAASAVSWLQDYDGGTCFFATPTLVAADSIAIEGFGRSIEAFETLNREFVKANGYEPKIGVRRIAEKQCGLADFMRSVEKLGGPDPLLELSNDRIKSGQSLKGIVSDIGNRSVSMWLIDDKGIIYDLNEHLKRTGERASFNIKLVGLKDGEPLPQLIFAISSEAPLESTSHTQPMLLSNFLAELASEVTGQQKTIGVAAKYFELGG